MKLFVNKEACIGCGACVAIDSKHFDFDEDGYSEVISNEDIENNDTANAISSCPTNAISYVSDTETNENEHDCEHCENHECEHNKVEITEE